LIFSNGSHHPHNFSLPIIDIRRRTGFAVNLLGWAKSAIPAAGQA
jgi:hypothetical protein